MHFKGVPSISYDLGSDDLKMLISDYRYSIRGAQS
jgi:hypothetical protein